MLRVRGISRVGSIARIVLERPDGDALPVLDAGTHLDVVTPSGIVRQYSLVTTLGPPDAWLIVVDRAPASRGGSSSLFDDLAPGDRVRVVGVRNLFPLRSGWRYIFLAGGVGITPIAAMIGELEARGVTAWKLLYGARDRSAMPFADELTEYGADRVELWPQDERGIPDLRAFVGEPDPGALVYCCGPEGMIRAAEIATSDWPAGSFRTERFSATPLLPGHEEMPFDVEIASTGRVLRVHADESILEVVRRVGIRVPSSCQEGTCGTCETGVLAGIPAHRDSILDAEERALNEVMFICVSRAKTPSLRLEL
ncbi:PDR/VanB family oxidoreductase [Microbacterium sp. zg.B48]|uniref:PDR/VanB family oxidoreductase n=1 Tax=Microbacterium sp. zg.B48 TaxID=2969408 RepID=UPI00214B3A73|nr:PDR/VanB family oxidoreductase [Microbacterium sp. zg.B48]MCR2764326.1 PDR/VanB family oxidoreductase [Microbacterium sp. zg.B48]